MLTYLIKFFFEWMLNHPITQEIVQHGAPNHVCSNCVFIKLSLLLTFITLISYFILKKIGIKKSYNKA